MRIDMKNNATDGLFQIESKGPWRTQYKTDSMLPNGRHEVYENGQHVGYWVQSTTGHHFETIQQAA